MVVPATGRGPCSASRKVSAAIAALYGATHRCARDYGARRATCGGTDRGAGACSPPRAAADPRVRAAVRRPDAPVRAIRVVNQNLLHGTACPADSGRCDLPRRVTLFIRQLDARECPELVAIEEANRTDGLRTLREPSRTVRVPPRLRRRSRARPRSRAVDEQSAGKRTAAPRRTAAHRAVGASRERCRSGRPRRHAPREQQRRSAVRRIDLSAAVPTVRHAQRVPGPRGGRVPPGEARPAIPSRCSRATSTRSPTSRPSGRSPPPG